ncbi:histidine kinase 2/3/4 (cytokinin receptor), partial [Nannochloropsis gaditana CCMP526]|uniref:histidine kinase 2/3/4 (cytokinin receptor) n=1 Tax=Nannochloropsis gaditana (strain CCMP526) TaxID=1093141 RepID=UPI00029F7EC0
SSMPELPPSFPDLSPAGLSSAACSSAPVSTLSSRLRNLPESHKDLISCRRRPSLTGLVMNPSAPAWAHSCFSRSKTKAETTTMGMAARRGSACFLRVFRTSIPCISGSCKSKRIRSNEGSIEDKAAVPVSTNTTRCPSCWSMPPSTIWLTRISSTERIFRSRTGGGSSALPPPPPP